MSVRNTPSHATALPRGVVTFLFTDVEGSTRLWRQGAEAAGPLARQARLIEAAVTRYGGVRPLDQGEGDSLLAAFVWPSAGLAAALDAQRALTAEPWPEGCTVRVRMAVHSGEAVLRETGNYGGTAIIRGARLRALAHGGQVLVSSTTAALASDALPEGATLEPLDTVTLPGFDTAERVHQLCHPDLPAEFAPLRHGRVRNLSAWPTPLIGRARERSELAAALAAARLVTVTGAGGSGKTRLAHAVAEDIGGRWRDGVVWVELSRLTSPEQVASTVAAACGLPSSGTLPALDALATFLAPTEVLIVLDNCEHLLVACAQLADALLRAAPGLTLLATSREPLGVGGEASWRIPSLDLPPAGEADPARLLEYDAVRLFVERARAVRDDFALTVDSAATVTHVCRRLDGIPLALELAAARVRGLAVERLAEALDDRFRVLTGGSRTALARQRTLLASVEWSYDLLENDERALFRCLGVFAAPFSLEAVEAVAAGGTIDPLAVVEVLLRLVDKSLVLHVDGRYRLLETLRQYALQRAHEAGELPALRDRHLAWMRRRAGDWRLDREVATEELMAEVASEEADLLAALEWSQAADGTPACDLLHAIGRSLSYRHAAEETRLVARRVLDPLEEGSQAWLEVLAPLAVPLFLASEAGWMPAARAALDTQGESLAPGVRAPIELALSSLSGWGGRPEGFAGMRRALADARRAQSRGLEVDAAVQLASQLVTIGERAAARPYLSWLEHHMPSNAHLAFLRDMALSLAATYDGDFATAERLVRRRLDEGRDHASIYVAGLIAYSTEDRELARRAVELIERLPPNGVYDGVSAVIRFGAANLEDGVGAARRHLESGLGLVTLPGVDLYMRYLLGQVELAEGRFEAAEALASEIETQVEGTLLHIDAAWCGMLRALLFRERGEAAMAETTAHAALSRAVANDLNLIATEGLEVLALLAADGGDAARAGRLLGAAEAFRERTSFRWRDGYQRRALAALHERLDPVHLEEGARMSLAEAAAWAQRGRGERGRPSHGWESLTPSELRVVELVAAGLPNKEIAARLFVSVGTVKTHLIHVFGKLGMRTRAELAAAAVARGLQGR